MALIVSSSSKPHRNSTWPINPLAFKIDSRSYFLTKCCSGPTNIVKCSHRQCRCCLSVHQHDTGRSGEGDNAGAPARVRREDAVAQHEIDPGPRGDRGQALEQLQRLEDEMLGAVGPGRLQGEHHAAVVQQAQPVLGHRGAQKIPASCGAGSYADLAIARS